MATDKRYHHHQTIALLTEIDALHEELTLDGPQDQSMTRSEAKLLEAIAQLQMFLSAESSKESGTHGVGRYLEEVVLLRQEVAAREQQLEQLRQVLEQRRTWVTEVVGQNREIQLAIKNAEELIDQVWHELQEVFPAQFDHEEREILADIHLLQQEQRGQRMKILETLGQQADGLIAQQPELSSVVEELADLFRLVKTTLPKVEVDNLDKLEEVIKQAQARLEEEVGAARQKGSQLTNLLAEVHGSQQKLDWLQGENEGRRAVLDYTEKEKQSLEKERMDIRRELQRAPTREDEYTAERAANVRSHWLAGEIAGRLAFLKLLGLWNAKMKTDIWQVLSQDESAAT